MPTSMRNKIYGPAAEALVQFGEGLSLARRRRGWDKAQLALMANLNRMTIAKMEAGDPSVSIGSYAQVMACFEMLEPLRTASSTHLDRAGLAMADAALPLRVSPKRRRVR